MAAESPTGMSWILSNLDGVVAGLALAGTALHAGISYLWSAGKKMDGRFKAQDRRIEEVKGEAARAHGRLDLIDQGLENLATKEDIAGVMQALMRQDGDRRELAEKVEGIRELMDRLEKPLDVIMQAALQSPMIRGNGA